MVAITTDTAAHLHRRPALAAAEPTVLVHPAGGGESLLPSDLRARVMMLVVAVVAVVAVGVATAGLGRILDGQRGIPAAAAPQVSVDG